MTSDSTAKLDPSHWNDEQEFKRHYPWVWAGTLFGPPMFAIGSLLFIWIAFGWESAVKLATTALVSFFLAGKMIILAVASSIWSSEISIVRSSCCFS